MPKIIPVPGIGNVAFPDGMADEEINRVLIGAAAKSRLAGQGLTPEAVKAGQGVASPAGEFADATAFVTHPLDTASGFLSSLNPLPAMARGSGPTTSKFYGGAAIDAETAARAAAWNRLNSRGSKLYTEDPASPDAGEDLRSMFEYAVPVFGPMIAGAGRRMESTDPSERARGFGQAVGMTSGPKIVASTTKIATDAAPQALTDLKAIAARQAIRGRNAQIGATPKDIALGGDPGRGVAAIGTKSIGGFGRAEEISTGLDTAKAAKQDFMANDSRAQQRVFDPKPLIEQAIESKASLATSNPAFRSALTSFSNRMRASIAGITKGESRPLSAAEMDKLRNQIDANWTAANKQFKVVTETDTRMNDAAVDMDRALRHSLESEQSPIATEYKSLNQRIQDLTQAKTVQARTNDASMAPAQTPGQQKTTDLHTTGIGLARAALRPNPAGASPMNLLRNPYYNMLAKVGGLKTDLPVPQPYAPPIEGLSSPGYPTDIIPANYRSQPPQFAAGPSGPAYDVSPTSPSHFIDRAQALQQFAQAERQAPSEVSVPPGGRYRTMAAGPEGPAFDPSMVRPIAVNQGGFQVAPQTPSWMGGQQLGTLPNGLPPRIPDWLLQQYMREIGMRNIDTNPIR